LVTFLSCTRGIFSTSFPLDIPGQFPPHVGNILVKTPQGDITASKGGIVQIAFGKSANHDGTITLIAGTEVDKKVVYVGNINSGDSGVIGARVVLKATGNIKGVVVGSQSVDISSQQNVNVLAISGGGVSVSASGSVSGTIAGAGNVNVSGSEVNAALVGNVSVSGNLTGAAAPAPVAANQEGTQNANKVVKDDSAGNSDETDDQKKKGRPVISEYVGRVTVILPKS